jgi:hypothetical protein
MRIPSGLLLPATPAAIRAGQDVDGIERLIRRNLWRIEKKKSLYGLNLSITEGN